MSNKLESLAMVDIAYELLKESNKPLAIQEIFHKVAEIKKIDLDDVNKITQLYVDITRSAKFVYCGDDKWDLKDGNLHLWDDDGSSFVEKDIILSEISEEEIELLNADEEILEDVIELLEEDEEILEEDEEKEIKPIKLDDEFDLSDEVYNEDDYNEIMDDYEDMYDDK